MPSSRHGKTWGSRSKCPRYSMEKGAAESCNGLAEAKETTRGKGGKVLLGAATQLAALYCFHTETGATRNCC